MSDMLAERHKYCGSAVNKIQHKQIQDKQQTNTTQADTGQTDFNKNTNIVTVQ